MQPIIKKDLLREKQQQKTRTLFKNTGIFQKHCNLVQLLTPKDMVRGKTGKKQGRFLVQKTGKKRAKPDVFKYTGTFQVDGSK